MKLCPICEKENPSSANHCMHCGNVLSPNEKLEESDKIFRELNEIKKTNELLKSALESELKNKQETANGKTENIIVPLPQTAPEQKNDAKTVAQPKSNKKTLALIFVMAALALIVFGVFYYQNIYLPEKVDREAPRYYTFADKTVLRSTREAGVDYSKIASLNYGSELITYSHDINGWSEVKDDMGNKGFIASAYLLDKTDFSILNNIFGDPESKQCIGTTKCRLALLNYYKTNTLNDTWKVFSRPKDAKINTVFYPRIYSKNSKFTDFAVIIKDTQTGNRKILVFGFNDDETLAWTKDGNAPNEGYIKKIYLTSSGTINVDYSD
ncbi:MAG TPA: SH3 domain-containing protein [Draconibacterium sp.]|nr:SH3 domain-containing protein [Draconibacterium sp.]